MSVIFLYHTEDPAQGGTLSTGNGPMISLLDHFVARFDGRWEAIHPGGYRSYAGTNHESLAAARKAYPDHRWVFLDPNGETPLSKFEHPEKNVVYVVGPDHEASVFDLAGGETVRIESDQELFAIAALIMAICDREIKAWR
jgi:hypothetical protein